MGDRSRKSSWALIGGGALILLLTVEVIVLAYQNRELKAALENRQHSMEPLKRGEKVEPPLVQSLDGGSFQLTFQDPAKKYLFFVFSTSCPHCEKNLVAWNSIAAKLKSTGCFIVGMSINSVKETQEYAAVKGAHFYMVSVQKDTSFSRRYHILGVPETILVGGDGVVEGAWVGELSAEQSDQIAREMQPG